MEGTYPLPEAQLDRFLMKILVKYPSREDLSTIVTRTIQKEETPIQQILTREEILELRRVGREVLVAPHVQSYAIDLVMATQPEGGQGHELAQKFIRYGASPRGAQALVECGQVHALLEGRLHLSTDDIQVIAPAVLRHRIILNFDAHAEGQTPETVLEKIIPSVSREAPRSGSRA
jgi:MoxR-like ATPase